MSREEMTGKSYHILIYTRYNSASEVKRPAPRPSSTPTEAAFYCAHRMGSQWLTATYHASACCFPSFSSFDRFCGDGENTLETHGLN